MGLKQSITDIHVHIQPWEELKPSVRATMRSSKADYEKVDRFIKDPAAFVEHLDRIGVDRVGLINYPSPDVMGFSERVNEFCSRYRDAFPSRFIAFGGIHPRLCKNPRETMKRLSGDLRIDAVKLHPPHQLFRMNGYQDGSVPALEVILEHCQEHGLPVMVHTGTSVFPGARNRFAVAMDLDDVALDFPDLKLILAHLGRPLEMSQVFFLMRRHSNLHADCSGIPPQKLLDYFPRLEELADRILFGTDWPSPGVPSIEDNLSRFRSLPLSEASFKKILAGNTERLFPRSRT